MTTLSRACLHRPRRHTAASIHLGVERDTRGLDLLPEQRLNCYPASPLVVLSWIFHGQLHRVRMLAEGGPVVLSEALSSMVLAGPSRTPSMSWSPGPVHAISIGLYPDAVRQMFGIEPHALMDQVLPAAACRILEQVQPGQGRLFEQLEAAIYRCTPTERLGSKAGSANLHDWLRTLAMRAAMTRPGTGLRQLQRQIKRWAGQSQRELQLYVRVERAFDLLQQQEKTDWSALALQAGYSDQSHFGREVKRITGYSPARFAQRLQTDEAFWMYRLLGEC